MTKVSYIHGLPDSQNAPKKVAQRRLIDYRSMTDGELRLSLMAEQLRIQAEYYGNDEYQAGVNRIESALQAGISGHKVRAGQLAGRLGKAIDNEISRARRMKRPAAGKLLVPRKGLGIGNTLVPTQDCTQYLQGEWWLGDQDNETQAYRDCEEQNSNLQLLNTHLEDVSHHLLYEYLQVSGSGTAITKRVLHRNAVSKLAEITEVERNNIRLWIRNGVMRANAASGTDPLQPEDTIEILRLSGLQDANVGVLPALVTALPAILSAFVAAVGATLALIENIRANKRQQLLVAAQGIGTATFGPEGSDWYNQSGTTTNNQGLTSDGNMLPLLLAGGAFLLLK